MANLNLIVSNERETELVTRVDHSAFNGLLSDEVVMQWLMELEAEDCASDLDDNRRIQAVPSCPA
ncbi:MAG: hypothetical protein JJU31_12040 [Wenzhouxiangella sp.]|nr:hypothetical protein [Wenzhouxiangella sp.]MCH8476570.1 hypothetical protein [Wenzhouxiangella sp.]